MRKFLILFSLVCAVSLMAETITFEGTYRADERKVKAEGRKGFSGGCIYSGKMSNGKIVKVYTKETCSTKVGSKDRIKGTFVCQVTCDQCENGRKQEYLTYEGTCKESD